MIYAGTGHRPNKLGGYSLEAYKVLVSLAEDFIYEYNPTKIISGMALGWDQALAQAAINTDVPLTAAIPFEGQERLWNSVDRLRYNNILNKAGIIEYCSEPLPRFSGKAEVSYAMQQRNKWMVDNSDSLIAVWDYSPGGTRNCVEYAQRQKKPVINLYWQYLKIAL